MLVLWRSLNGSHKSTAQCNKGAESKRRWLVAEEARDVRSRAFSSYSQPLEMLTPFKYLGRLLSAADDDWPAVIHNLEKARTVWRRILRTLSSEGERPRVYEFFFKTVVQLMLLFGEETWVVTPRMGRVLGVSKTRWCSD